MRRRAVLGRTAGLVTSLRLALTVRGYYRMQVCSRTIFEFMFREVYNSFDRFCVHGLSGALVRRILTRQGRLSIRHLDYDTNH